MCTIAYTCTVYVHAHVNTNIGQYYCPCIF